MNISQIIRTAFKENIGQNKEKLQESIEKNMRVYILSQIEQARKEVHENLEVTMLNKLCFLLEEIHALNDELQDLAHHINLNEMKHFAEKMLANLPFHQKDATPFNEKEPFNPDDRFFKLVYQGVAPLSLYFDLTDHNIDYVPFFNIFLKYNNHIQAFSTQLDGKSIPALVATLSILFDGLEENQNLKHLKIGFGHHDEVFDLKELLPVLSKHIITFRFSIVPLQPVVVIKNYQAFLGKNPGLKHLGVTIGKGTFIVDEDITQLVIALKKNSTLQSFKLVLCHAAFEEESLQTIFNVLEYNGTLEKLIIIDNNGSHSTPKKEHLLEENKKFRQLQLPKKAVAEQTPLPGELVSLICEYNGAGFFRTPATAMDAQGNVFVHDNATKKEPLKQQSGTQYQLAGTRTDAKQLDAQEVEAAEEKEDWGPGQLVDAWGEVDTDFEQLGAPEMEAAEEMWDPDWDDGFANDNGEEQCSVLRNTP